MCINARFSIVFIPNLRFVISTRAETTWRRDNQHLEGWEIVGVSSAFGRGSLHTEIMGRLGLFIFHRYDALVYAHCTHTPYRFSPFYFESSKYALIFHHRPLFFFLCNNNLYISMTSSCVLQIILRTSTYKQNGTNWSWFILPCCQLYQYAGMRSK